MSVFQSLKEDYVVDALLSFGDELLLVVGLDLDIGDLAAAVKVFMEERKVVGGLWAIIPALEAANFIIGMIPYVGTPIEYITNIFPAVTVTRMFFSKFPPAKRKMQELKEKLGEAGALGLDVSEEASTIKKAKEMIEDENPVGALEEEENTISRVKRKMKSITGAG